MSFVQLTKSFEIGVFFKKMCYPTVNNKFFLKKLENKTKSWKLEFGQQIKRESKRETQNYF